MVNFCVLMLAAACKQEKGEDEQQQQQETMNRSNSGNRPIRKASQSKASKFFGVGAAVVEEEAGPIETLKIEEEGLLMWRNEVRLFASSSSRPSHGLIALLA